MCITRISAQVLATEVSSSMQTRQISVSYVGSIAGLVLVLQLIALLAITLKTAFFLVICASAISVAVSMMMELALTASNVTCPAKHVVDLAQQVA